MGPVIFVEVLDRRRRLRARARFDRFPARIGRGYGNDLIVDDRLLEAEHLRIVETDEGGLSLESASGAEGFEDPRTGRALDRVPVADDLEVRAGATIFRLRTPEHDVGPPIRQSRDADAFLARLGSWPAAGTALAALVSVVAWNGFLQVWKEQGWALLATATSIFLGMHLIWAGLWSFAGRVISHEGRMRHHLTLTCLAGVGLVVWNVLWDYVSFLTSAEGSLARAAGGCAIPGALVYAQLSLVSTQSRSRRLVPAAAVTAGLLVIVLLVQHAVRQQFPQRPRFPAQLKPLPAAVLPAAEPAAFFAATPKLRDRVDRLAAEGD